MVNDRPLCRYCAKPIPKLTITVVFTEAGNEIASANGFWRQKRARPKTREDAQRLVNETIISVRYATDSNGRYVCQATAWDGESYRDKHFCKDACARLFGEMVAEAKPEWASRKYWEAIEKLKIKRAVSADRQ